MTPDPFELIDSPFAEGKIERWRAEAMAGGAMGALQNVYDIVRADASEAAARADAEQAREGLIAHVCDQITELSRRFDALEARLAAAEDARRADVAAREEFEEEPLALALPPDLSEYQARTPPAGIVDVDETHQPSGDLHAIAAKDEPPVADPEDRDDDDNVGDLPPGLADPPEPVPEPRGKVQPQPIAISLNQE